MKKLFIVFLVIVLIFVVVACRSNIPTTEYHETGFDMGKLYINIGDKTYAYERCEEGTHNFKADLLLDRFYIATEIESIGWEVYSVKGYPNYSYVLLMITAYPAPAQVYRICDEN